MRIGVSLLALLMIGAVAVGPAAAEDAGGDSSGAKNDGNSSGSGKLGAQGLHQPQVLADLAPAARGGSGRATRPENQ